MTTTYRVWFHAQRVGASGAELTMSNSRCLRTTPFVPATRLRPGYACARPQNAWRAERRQAPGVRAKHRRLRRRSALSKADDPHKTGSFCSQYISTNRSRKSWVAHAGGDASRPATVDSFRACTSLVAHSQPPGGPAEISNPLPRAAIPIAASASDSELAWIR